MLLPEAPGPQFGELEGQVCGYASGVRVEVPAAAEQLTADKRAEIADGLLQGHRPVLQQPGQVDSGCALEHKRSEERID